MKSYTLMLCLALDSIGAFFGQLSPDEWVRLATLVLSLISIIISLILKIVSIVKKSKTKEEAVVESLETAQEHINQAEQIINAYQKNGKKKSRYRIEEKK